MEHRHRRAVVSPRLAGGRGVIDPLAGVVEGVGDRRVEADGKVRTLAEHRPADGHPVARAGHRREGEADRRAGLGLGVPELVQHRGHPGDGADRGLAEELEIVRRAGRGMGQLVQGGGDLYGGGDLGIGRRRMAGDLEVLANPGTVLGQERRPGHHLVDHAQHLLEALVMILAVVVAAGGGGRRRLEPAGVAVGRVVGFQRRHGRPVPVLHRQQVQLQQPRALLQHAAFALVGDGVHHGAHLGEGDVLVGQGHGGFEAHELPHGVAGAEVVEQVVLLAARIVDLIPEAASVRILQVEVVEIALVHPTDGAERRQGLARLPVGEGRLGEVLPELVLPDVAAGVVGGLFYGQEQLQLLATEGGHVHRDAGEGGGVLQVDDVGDGAGGRRVTGPAVVGVLQGRAGEVRGQADGGGHVGGQLEVQHLLDEHREDDVEGLFVGGGRMGHRRQPGPQPPLVEGVSGAGDLVHPVDGIEAGHVERDGEELDLHRRLGDGLQRGLVGGLFGRIAQGLSGQADGSGDLHPCPRGRGPAARKRTAKAGPDPARRALQPVLTGTAGVF